MSPTEATHPSERKRRGLRRLAVTLGSFVVFFVLAEVVVRVAVPGGRLLRLTQLDEALAGSKKQQFMATIEDDPETFWRFAPNVELPPGSGPFFGRISNDQGLREQEHIAVPKPRDELRVLFLGDSCTFGYRLDEPQTFVALTEKRLRGRFPNRRIECVNGGVPGYTAFQCLRKLENEGFDYDPDIVVMQFGWNEKIVWDGRSDPEHYRALQACRPPGFLAASRLCQLLWTYAKWPSPNDDGRARLSPAEFRNILQKIADATRARKVDFLLLVTGCRQNVRDQVLTPLQAEQLQFSATLPWPDQKTGFVNAVTELTRLVLEKKRDVGSLLFDEAHPTMAYGAIIADALVYKITPWILAR
jgi:lysophospholipase L1-like esterase